MISNQNIMSMAENGDNEVDINMLANFDMTFFKSFWVFVKSGSPHIRNTMNNFMDWKNFLCRTSLNSNGNDQ